MVCTEAPVPASETTDAPVYDAPPGDKIEDHHEAFDGDASTNLPDEHQPA